MKKFFSDFKKFISKGNILDMAVGVIIGGAFNAIVTAFTNKIIMPLVNWFLLAVTGSNGLDAIYTYLHKAYVLDDLGNPTDVVDLANSIYIDWGAFITAVINFLLVALILFIIIKAINNIHEKGVAAKEALVKKEEKPEEKKE